MKFWIILWKKKLIEPFSIIIEAPILSGLFKDEEWTKDFLKIVNSANTVICCRVSPSQKSEVIRQMKNFDKKAVTMAIGDGGNDVSMIMEANIGIGIFGEEGVSAAQASDFTIGEFHLIKRLLFIHGRINLFRISKMIFYFFFKNFVFTMIQFYYSFISLNSGQTFVDDWYITFYNLLFTALPLCVSALTDSDVNLNDKKEIKNLPLLYKENRDEFKVFCFRRFLLKLSQGIVYSFLTFLICLSKETLYNGRSNSLWYLSLKTYTIVLIVVSINLVLNTNFIVTLLPIAIGLTTFFLFGIFLVFNHYGILFSFKSKASIRITFMTYIAYSHIIFVCGFTFIVDYTVKLLILFFSSSLSSKIIMNDLRKKNRVSAFINSKIYKAKVSSKSPIEVKKISLNDDNSRNRIILKNSQQIEKIFKLKEKSPKVYNNKKLITGKENKNESFLFKAFET